MPPTVSKLKEKKMFEVALYMLRFFAVLLPLALSITLPNLPGRSSSSELFCVHCTQTWRCLKCTVVVNSNYMNLTAPARVRSPQCISILWIDVISQMIRVWKFGKAGWEFPITLRKKVDRISREGEITVCVVTNQRCCYGRSIRK
jgi:hypothetical protein